jgi:uncharacterized membrane-anchored protein
MLLFITAIVVVYLVFSLVYQWKKRGPGPKWLDTVTSYPAVVFLWIILAFADPDE